MLIVCPNCGTSYLIDQASVGPAGRTVRCARCRSTWFAGGAEAPPKSPSDPATNIAPDVSAFVDGVIAEAEAQSGGGARPRAESLAPTRAHDPGGDDFGEHDDEPPDTAEPHDAYEPAGPAHPPMPRADTFASAREPELPQSIADAPSLVPPIVHEVLPDGDAASDPEDDKTFAARRQRLESRRKQSRRSSRWTALLLVLLAFNVAVVGARYEVVRYLPQTASLFAAIGLPVNLRHLRFEDVRISKENEEGVPILIVRGWIVSDDDKPTEVPRLRFAARNKTGQEVYTWTMLPDRSILQPGEKLAFRSRLGAPPKDAQDVMVRFFKTSDAMAGAK